MADLADITDERDAPIIEADVVYIRQKAAAIPAGRPGECDFCGETFARVVEVTDPRTGEVVESCGRCRDRRGIA